jgi:uncharacterized protein with HEPN domain
MPSSDPIQRFQDILDNIDLIQSYLQTISKADFFKGGMVYDATAYCFLRLAEAATKLDRLGETLAPQIPWKRIRGLGNHLRHAYDGIDPGILWDAAQVDLPPLQEACRTALDKLEASN